MSSRMLRMRVRRQHLSYEYLARWFLFVVGYYCCCYCAPRLPVACAQLSLCEMRVEAYASFDDCFSGTVSPVATGTIYGDGTCRNDLTSPLLPGIYRAQCTGNGNQEVTFVGSGCSSLEACEADGGDVCPGDNTVESFIYARVTVNGLAQGTYRTNGLCYSGSATNALGQTITVSFKVNGFCDSACANNVVPTDPPVPPPTPAPTEPPVLPATPAPTDAPVSPPTDPPVAEVSPTDAPVAPPIEPTVAMPVAEAPVSAPVAETPSAPDVPSAPVTTPTAPVVPETPSAPETTPTTATTTRNSTITTGLRFQPKFNVLPTNRLDAWVRVTEEFLQSRGDIANVAIYDVTQDLVSTTRRRLTDKHQQRRQQEKPSLEIYFTLDGTHEKDSTLRVVLDGSLDTASERTQYLQSLIAELPDFEEVETVRTTSANRGEVDDAPSAIGEDAPSGNSSGNTGLIAGVVVAVVLVVFVGLAAAGCFLWRRRQRSKEEQAKEAATNGQTKQVQLEPTASSTDPNNVLPKFQEPTPPPPTHQPQQRRLRTNEIIEVNPQECDDISALEGATLPENAEDRVYDDPTATVDLTLLNYEMKEAAEEAQFESDILEWTRDWGKTSPPALAKKQ